MSRLVVQAQRVGKTYPGGGRPVLRDVSLSLQAGDSLALMGRSGSGKSTLMHILGALDPHFHGEVEICGAALRQLSDGAASRLRRQHIGFVFQNFHLLGHMNALENVVLPAHFAGARPSLGRGRELLAAVGLAARADHRPAALSGGERQRVALARALYMRPDLLLCDEPTGSLDGEAAATVLELLVDLARQGTAWIIVTHDPLVAARARRQLRVADGQVAAAAARPAAE